MPKIDPKIEAGWKQHLVEEFSAGYFVELKAFLEHEKATRQVIYPPGSKIFAAFDYTSWDRLKVVIIGQDPYHGPGQANGLCFSVSPGIRKPPSLENIYKEIHADLGHPVPEHGDLTPWARQGVLLLNAMLTVRAGQAGSHQGKGWEAFTNAVIRRVSEEKEGLVFLLWGKFAQGKEALIDTGKHHVLKCAHPSPFSAHSGFFGCRHFSKTNALLEAQGQTPIDWRID